MKPSRTARLLPCLLLSATLLAAAGCDWLSASGSTARASPVLRELNVTPASVFCGPRNPLEVSFGYSDPQGDYYQMIMVLERTQPDQRIERSALWTTLDLTKSPGRAIYKEFFFECGAYPAGTWTLKVTVEDERGHLSNEIASEINLVSSG